MNTPQSPAMIEVDRLPELPPARHLNCGIDHFIAEDMRTYATEAIAAERAEVVRLREELNLASVGEFGAQSANRHLSALVDFERQVSERCMAVMKALMDAAEPVNNEFQDCHIDYADYAKFVDAHAELLYVIKNGERPAALATPTQGGAL